MDRENQAVYAALDAATQAAERVAASAAGTVAMAEATAEAASEAEQGKPARPGKEQVRRWLAERAGNRQPLPEPDAIRRAVGWPAAAAEARQLPQLPQPLTQPLLQPQKTLAAA